MAGVKKPSQKQWDAYGAASDELLQAWDEFKKSADSWVAAAKGLTDPENIMDFRDELLEYGTSIKDFAQQYYFDAKDRK